MLCGDSIMTKIFLKLELFVNIDELIIVIISCWFMKLGLKNGVISFTSSGERL